MQESAQKQTKFNFDNTCNRSQAGSSLAGMETTERRFVTAPPGGEHKDEGETLQDAKSGEDTDDDGASLATTVRLVTQTPSPSGATTTTTTAASSNVRIEVTRLTRDAQVECGFGWLRDNMRIHRRGAATSIDVPMHMLAQWVNGAMLWKRTCVGEEVAARMCGVCAIASLGGGPMLFFPITPDTPKWCFPSGAFTVMSGLWSVCKAMHLDESPLLVILASILDVRRTPEMFCCTLVDWKAGVAVPDEDAMCMSGRRMARQASPFLQSCCICGLRDGQAGANPLRQCDTCGLQDMCCDCCTSIHSCEVRDVAVLGVDDAWRMVPLPVHGMVSDTTRMMRWEEPDEFACSRHIVNAAHWKALDPDTVVSELSDDQVLRCSYFKVMVACCPPVYSSFVSSQDELRSADDIADLSEGAGAGAGAASMS